MRVESTEIFTIDTRKLNLIDLDFPDCALQLKDYIDENVPKIATCLLLDIRLSVVIYSQAPVFLDRCLLHLAQSEGGNKSFRILTTGNYMTRELTCYELFRTTQMVNQGSHDPRSVAAKVDKYCIDNNLKIFIDVYSGDTVDPSTPVLMSFDFPQGSSV